MTCTSDKPGGRLVLYHAVSSYQLLEVMLHRTIFHPADRAVLLLPDFFTQKYPQTPKLTRRRFFDEAYLFPYLRIPHRSEAEILEDAQRFYRRLVPYDLKEFSKIYIAGAHFYFSLCPISQVIPFAFFEDAAGMLSRAGELARALRVRYPVHAEIAQKYGLFDGSHPLISQILCLKRAQTIDVSGAGYTDFSVEQALQGLPGRQRKRFVRFFLRRRLTVRADAILLTQQLANLGVMSEAEQAGLYRRFRREIPPELRLAIKKHPDDTVDYREIFPGAPILKPVFPSELLPYAFRLKPEILYTVSSTGCENLKDHFIIIKMGEEGHAGKESAFPC